MGVGTDSLSGVLWDFDATQYLNYSCVALIYDDSDTDANHLQWQAQAADGSIVYVDTLVVTFASNVAPEVSLALRPLFDT